MNKALLTLSILAALALPMLAGCAPSAEFPLEGTDWVLIFLGDKQPIPDHPLTARFEDGLVKGSAGCNQYSGGYQLNGNQIQMEGLISTLMACLEPEGLMDQEALFLEFMGDAQEFEISGGELQIIRSTGEALTFVPHE